MISVRVSPLLILSVLTAVHGLSTTYEGPKFTAEPSGLVEFSNSSGTLVSCASDGNPRPTVTWRTVDGGIVREVPGLRRIRHDGALSFPPFQADDYRADVHATAYVCVASNVIGSIVSRDVYVRAVVPQEYEIRLSDVFVLRGNTAALRCNIPSYVGDHVTVVSWEREDGFLIPPGIASGKYGLLENGDLYILDASEHDSKDSFRCHTENKITKEKRTSKNYARIIVTEPHRNQPPRVMRRSERVVVQLSQRAVLSCIAQGYPRPTYRWLRQAGHRLTVLDYGVRVRQEGGVLIFLKTVPSDRGKYTCLVSNSVGEDRAETELILIEPLRVLLTPEIVKANVAESIDFQCTIAGSTADAQILWLKDTKVLKSDSKNVQFQGPATLRLAHVRREDAGMYQCLVREHSDSAQAAARLLIGDLSPVLKFAFEERTVRPGSYVSMSCIASGNPAPEVKWMLDDMWSISTRPGLLVRSHVSKSGDVVSDVNITSVDVSDSGVYTCIAFNEVGSVTWKARLNVLGPLFVRALTNNVTALDGKDLSVTCPFGGYPFDTIRWKKEGRVLPVNQRQRVYPNGTMTITVVQQAEDDGMYTCEVTSEKDSTPVSATVRVIVRTGPKVSPFEFRADLHEGMRTAVTCVVSAGDTPFTIRWLKDGIPLKDGVLDATIHYPENGFVSTLSIDKLAYRHNGQYSCLATNDVATGSHVATLTVKVPPRWVLEPKDKSAVAGRPARIDCQADGVPLPHVRWKKATGNTPENFKTIVSSSHVHILVNGSLNFQSVELADAGFYVCEANNGVGMGLNSVIRFTVHSAPQFLSSFSVLTTRRGHRTQISCDAKGEKPMVFNWLKNGELVDPDAETRYVIEKKETADGAMTALVISKAERQDSALFTCTATNDYGEDSANVQLTVQDIPDAPQSLEVHDVLSRSVRLTWNRPFDGNSPITTYTVAWRQLSEDSSGGPQTMPGSETSLTVRGLRPATRYFFRVKCENELGESQFSAEVAATTLQEPPTMAPSLVNANPLSSSSINVSWQLPDDPLGGSNIEGFYIGYKYKMSPDPYTFLPVRAQIDKKRHHAALYNLNRLSEYAVVVQAYNSRGAGPPSQEVTVKTFEHDPPKAPSIKIQTVTSSSINVLWESQSRTEIPILGWFLYHRPEGGSWYENRVSGDRNSYTLKDLRCGTVYYCYAIAHNVAGRSNASEILSVKTGGNPPVAPEMHSFLIAQTTSVTAKFKSWGNGGCPTMSFALWHKRSDGRPDEWTLFAEDVSSSQDSVTVDGLNSGRWYQMKVLAKNDAGVTDMEYEFATLTMDGEIPPKPKDLRDASGLLYHHLTITVPVISLAFLLVLVIITACIVTRRRIMARRPSNPDGAESATQSKPEQLPLSVTYESSQEPTYYPSPYATGHIYQQSYQNRENDNSVPEKRTETIDSNASGCRIVFSPQRRIVTERHTRSQHQLQQQYVSQYITREPSRLSYTSQFTKSQTELEKDTAKGRGDKRMTTAIRAQSPTMKMSRIHGTEEISQEKKPGSPKQNAIGYGKHLKKISTKAGNVGLRVT